ncbi:MAG TPA: hypothetical protein VFE47_27880 [Tepidisphaeraceae bacterium]|nr:hypothetical protein [Tepidisphaeraceae bacterium]
MELISPEDFFEWIQCNGIGYSEEYPDYLQYRCIPIYSRFWQTPGNAGNLPHFIDRMLLSLSPWETCTLWPLAGRWPQVGPQLRIDDRVRDVVVRGAGIIPGFAGAVRFAGDEREKLVSVIFAQLMFGWSAPDDIVIVAGHCRQFLQTDHHHMMHATFSSEDQIQPYIAHMAAVGYDLPETVPDWTFIKPAWMD